jgi:hypothetical protein
MEFKLINTIYDLPTFDEINKWSHTEYEVKYRPRYNVYDPTLELNNILDYINTKIVNEINNKKDVIKLLLDKSVNRFNQNINYYNIIINNLQDIEDTPQYGGLFNIISRKILFTNTCTILYYKINNNLYNLYNFVEDNLIDKFNTILLSCLLSLYYLHDITMDNINIHHCVFQVNFKNLYLFKYTHELQNNELDNLNCLD